MEYSNIPTKKNFSEMRIVFFGTPEFAVASLAALVEDGQQVVAVVTMPDKPAGRNHRLLQSDVKKYALANNLPLLQPGNLKDPEFIRQLRELEADLFVVIAFRMLPEAVWSMPPKGTFNLHASLLPKYRGAAPINRAVMNGETRTGVTTFFLKHEIDTGDIIDREEIEIGPEENVGEIHDRLMELGASMVVRTVREIEAGTVKTTPQPEGDFTPAPKIFREDCLIDWNRDASSIHNHIRGLSPYPAAYSLLIEEGGRRFDTKIFSSRITDKDAAGMETGKVVVEGKKMFVATADFMIEIMELQPSGKKRMDSGAFLLGYNPDRFQ